MSLDRVLAKLGQAPIECGYDNPNCVSGGSTPWGAGGVRVPSAYLAPPMQTLNYGDNPIDNPPLEDQIYPLGTGGIKPIPTTGHQTFSDNRGTRVIIKDNPATVNNVQATIDSIINTAKANPVLALAVVGFGFYLVKGKK